MAKHVLILHSRRHRDEALLEDLLVHLAPLEQAGLASLWHPGRVAAGAAWREEIDRELDTADVVLLLLSPNAVRIR